MKTLMRGLLLALMTCCLWPAHVSANPTPPPNAKPIPLPYPSVALHTEFVVEVNHLGQIVRVKSGKSCKNLAFNAQTYGNVLQMWIRKPDGTAVVGMYRVTYDYDPKTHDVHRGVALLKEGGDWGDELGAANEMLQKDNTLNKNRPLPGWSTIAQPTPHPAHT